MSQSPHLDLDQIIAEAIRRDFRAMSHAMAMADINRIKAAFDCEMGKSGTRGGSDERLMQAFVEEDQ